MFHQYLMNTYFIILLIFFVAILLDRLISNILVPRLLKIFARRKNATSRIITRKINSLTHIWLPIGAFYLVIWLISKNYIEKPIGFEYITYIELFARFVLIISIIVFFNSLFQELLSFYTRKDKLPQTTIFSNLTKVGIFLIAISIILWAYGFSIAPIVATLGIGGLAIALALQDTLSSLFAGIYIIMSKQINPGDFIKLQSGEEGYVEDINWRNTTIRTIENNIIVIPNKNLANTTLVNYNILNSEMSVVVLVGVHYDSDLDLVEKVCIEVANDIVNTQEGGVTSFEPRIRYREFGESAIIFRMIFRVSEYQYQAPIRHEFIRALRKRFKKEGIVIPYPMRTITHENSGFSPRENQGQ